MKFNSKFILFSIKICTPLECLRYSLSSSLHLSIYLYNTNDLFFQFFISLSLMRFINRALNSKYINTWNYNRSNGYFSYYPFCTAYRLSIAILNAKHILTKTVHINAKFNSYIVAAEVRERAKQKRLKTLVRKVRCSWTQNWNSNRNSVRFNCFACGHDHLQLPLGTVRDTRLYFI